MQARSMQAKEETGTTSTLTSLRKQATMVTEVANKVPPYSGTIISQDFLKSRMSTPQSLLTKRRRCMVGDCWQQIQTPPLKVRGIEVNQLGMQF